MRRGSKKSGGKWPKWAAVAGCWLLVAGLLLYRLASLTHGPSQEEFSISQQNGSLTAILRTPLFLPLHLLQWLIFTVTRHHGLYTLRVASVVFGLLAIAAFWYVARKWYGLRTGLFATVLFAASAWTLHVSRYGGDSVMYLWALPALLLLLVLWEKPHKTWLNTVVAGLLVAVLLYVPGVIWLLLVVAALNYDVLIESWKNHSSSAQRLTSVAVAAVALIPLLWSFIRMPQLIGRWLGWPVTHDTLWHMVERLGLSVTYLFYRGPLAPEIWLDRQPILGIFVLVLLVAGIYFYLRHLRAARTQLLVALAIISTALFALLGTTAYSLIIPLAYLVAAAGLGYLIHEWLQVFPRNPLAKAVCYGMVSLVVALSAIYGLRSYFVAWPHNEATVRTFSDR